MDEPEFIMKTTNYHGTQASRVIPDPDPLTFDVQSDVRAVAGRILDFIGTGGGDWQVLVIAKNSLIQELLSTVQFTAPSHLGLSRTATSLNSRHGSILGTTDYNRIPGARASFPFFVVHSTHLSRPVLECIRRQSTVDPVLWVPQND